jgi:hypothetical protein
MKSIIAIIARDHRQAEHFARMHLLPKEKWIYVVDAEKLRGVSAEMFTPVFCEGWYVRKDAAVLEEMIKHKYQQAGITWSQ